MRSRSGFSAAVTVLSLSGSLALVAGMAPAAAAAIPFCGHLHEAQWACRYNGTGGQADIAMDEAISPSGSAVYVTGSSFGLGTLDDFATAAYQASTGQPLWLARYDGSDHLGDDATAVAVSPDGSKVFVTGSSIIGGDTNMATVAYDSGSGIQLWVALYPVAAGEALDVSPDGSAVYVTGWSVDGVTTETTVAYDTTLGHQLWVSLFSSGHFEEGKELTASPDGSRVFVTGASVGTSNDIATIAMDPSNGHVLWSSFYNDPSDGEDRVNGLAVSPDGSKVMVTGTDWSPDTYQDFVTIAYDGTSGDQSWIARYTSRHYNLDEANAIAVSPDGSSVFVTGETWVRQQVAYLTISYEAATGEQRWLTRYFHRYAIATAIGVSPDGSRVYVSGYTLDTWDEYATMAYDAATGGRLWIARTALDASEIARGLAVNPNGSSVVVTGTTAHGDYQTNDYLTVAYPA